jgi:hypothetical protein
MAMIPLKVTRTWPGGYHVVGNWKKLNYWRDSVVFEEPELWAIDSEAVEHALDHLDVKGRAYIRPEIRGGFFGEYIGMPYITSHPHHTRRRDPLRQERTHGRRGPIHEVHVSTALTAESASAVIWHELTHARQFHELYKNGYKTWTWILAYYVGHKEEMEKEAIENMKLSEQFPICYYP